MTVILFKNDESESTKSTVGWETKLEVSGDVGSGDFKIFVSCELAGTSTNREVACRVLVDATERNFHSFKPTTSDLYREVTFMGLLSLVGSHSLTLQFTPVSLPQTVKIRRARIFLEKY